MISTFNPETGDNPVIQLFDTMIERFQLHQHPNQQVHHVQQYHQISPQTQQLQSNHSQSQNTQSVVFNALQNFSGEAAKSCNPANNNQNHNNHDVYNDGGSPSNDGELSSISNDLVNSDDNLNISVENELVSFMAGVDSPHALKKTLDKSSEEYKKRRARNNVAVRKSREKAKQRSKDTEKRVSQLQNENDDLKRTVGNLNGKMAILVRLLGNVGISAEYIEDELNRSLP